MHILFVPTLLFLEIYPGNSLAVQWLGLCTFTTKGPGSIPVWGTKIPQFSWHGQKKKKKKKRFILLVNSYKLTRPMHTDVNYIIVYNSKYN